MIAGPDKVTVGVDAGTDDEGDFLLAGFTSAFKPLNYAGSARLNEESGLGEGVLEGSVGLRSRPAERMRHSRLPVAQHLLGVAGCTLLISGESRRAKSQDHSGPHCF